MPSRLIVTLGRPGKFGLAWNPVTTKPQTPTLWNDGRSGPISFVPVQPCCKSCLNTVFKTSGFQLWILFQQQAASPQLGFSPDYYIFFQMVKKKLCTVFSSLLMDALFGFWLYLWL